MIEQVKSLLRDSAKWAKSGFKLASGDVITDRYSKCKACKPSSCWRLLNALKVSGRIL